MAFFDIKGRDALSQTSAAETGNQFDASGWNVNFGGSGGITSQRTQTDNGPLGGLAALSTLPPYVPYLAVAAALVLAWRMTRR